MKKETKNPRHWMYGTITYKTWQSIKSRLRQNPYYKNVEICQKWLRFKGFHEDMGSRPSIDYQIDRIDNSKGYCKENCRWVTRSEQMKNRSITVWLTMKGETKCLSDWAKEVGIDHRTITKRIRKHNWSVEKALTTKTPNQRYQQSEPI